MSAQQSVLLIAGSPSERSRSSALLDSVSHRLALRSGFVVDRLNIRELPAQALLLAKWGHPAIAAAMAQVAGARAIVVATPVYKAAYSGLLKVLLDLLPVETPRGIITSVIPTRSVDQLELVIGSDVVALVKSTEVSIPKL